MNSKDLLKKVKINQDNADLLCARISQEAQQEVKNILSCAEKDAQKILQEAKAKVETKKEKSLKELERELVKSRERTLSSVNLEKKRLILQEKSIFVQSVFDSVSSLAAEFRKKDDYYAFLEKAILEGIEIIEEENIEVYYSYLDGDIFTEGFVKKIEDSCSDRLKKKCIISINKSDFKEIGIIVNSKDGRRMYDNRFSARLHRIYDQVYMELLKEVF